MSVSPVEIRDLTFSYNSADPVLSDFSLSLDVDERLVVTGANGCGKTTLLHLIMGLESLQSGTIEILGTPRETEADFMDARKHVGLLFQDVDNQLFSPTVFEDVAFGPLNLGHSPAESHDMAHETLEQLGLGDLTRRITYQLSHGQKRLVALATILAMKPEVLLLDEPTTGLDETHEARLTEILAGLPQSMLIVSHNQPFIERIGTRSLGL
ncbi:MAG TPA: ABC transporter ATP-binding protein [Candidatus Hydrogenedentes bacterium]|nr:ABC transporter ATP-binding protein [Candidatus Hydrogenedentota bacterium]